MADRSIRVPRASIAVPILHDPDYLELVGHPGGFAAFGIFTALLVAAKQQQNHGVFKLPRRNIAALIGATGPQLSESIRLMATAAASNGSKPWLTTTTEAIIIRQFEKWNCNWGGARVGAGRPKKESSISSGNQDASLIAPSVSSSSSSSEHSTHSPTTAPSEQSTHRGGALEIARAESACGACPAWAPNPGHVAKRVIRASLLVAESSISARRQPAVLRAIAVLATHQDPVPVVRRVLDRAARPETKNPGGYAAKAIIEEATP